MYLIRWPCAQARAVPRWGKPWRTRLLRVSLLVGCVLACGTRLLEAPRGYSMRSPAGAGVAGTKVLGQHGAATLPEAGGQVGEEAGGRVPGWRPGAPRGGVDCGEAEACTGTPFAAGADAWEFMRAGWAPPCGVMSDAPRRRLACFPPGKTNFFLRTTKPPEDCGKGTTGKSNKIY